MARRMRKLCITICAALIVTVLFHFFFYYLNNMSVLAYAQDSDPTERRTLEALYASPGKAGGYLLFDPDSGEPVDWSGHLGQLVMDQDGHPIDKTQLKNGDRFQVTMYKRQPPKGEPVPLWFDDSWFALSSKMIAPDSPEEGEKNAALAEKYWRQAKPVDPPFLLVNDYLALKCSNSWWEYTSNGTTSRITGNGRHPMLQGWMYDIRLPKDSTIEQSYMKIFSDYPSTGCQVLRWEEGLRGTGEPEGEVLPITEEYGYYSAPVESGYIYEVTLFWEDSWCAYTFRATDEIE